MASLIKHGASVFSLDRNSHNILTILINNLSVDYYNTLEYLNILINQYILNNISCGCSIQREYLNTDICNYVMMCVKYYKIINNKDECIIK